MANDSLTFAKLCERVDVGFDGDTKALSEGLDEALAKVAAAAAQSGGKGTLTIRLTVKPKARDELIITADIKTTIPEPVSLPILAYVDKKGRLVGEDPNQGKLPMDVTVIQGGRDRAAAGGEDE